MFDIRLPVETVEIKDKIIGRGGTSVIYYCNDFTVAKKIKFQFYFPWLELYIMSHNFGKHVTRGRMKLFGDGVYIFQDKALGSLKDYSQQLSTKQIFSFMKQIVKGLRELHSRGFIHGDLKPSNILIFQVREKLKLKINDFGDATKYEWFHKGKTGSSHFRAPEQDFDGWDEKVDVWGLGHILSFFLVNSNDEGFIKELKQLKERMLRKNKEERISLQEVYEFFLPSSFVSKEENNYKIKSENFLDETQRLNKIFFSTFKTKKEKERIRHITKQMVYKEKIPETFKIFIDQIIIFLSLIENEDFVI